MSQNHPVRVYTVYIVTRAMMNDIECVPSPDATALGLSFASACGSVCGSLLSALLTDSSAAPLRCDPILRRCRGNLLRRTRVDSD